MANTFVFAVRIVNGQLITYPITTNEDEDYFVWGCDDSIKSFSLSFPDGSPFNQTPGSGSPGSPIVLQVSEDANVAIYKYDVTATPANGGANLQLDPHIIVSDSGAEGGSGGAAVTAPAIGQAVFSAVMKTLSDLHQQETGGKRFFFPFGIQSISVNVKGPSINVTVSGNTPG